MLKQTPQPLIFTAALGLFALLITLQAPDSQAACPLPLPRLILSINGHAVHAELAVTAAAQQCGLSKRDQLAPDRGMLFAFPQPVSIAFWMKDTRIPLSIAFLDDHGRILTMADMAAEDDQSRHRPSVPYRYALEMNLGWFEQHRVQAGDTVQFTLSDAR